jgi:adenine/guanine phosphoribosyltransferase-like PRPP-binding protein
LYRTIARGIKTIFNGNESTLITRLYYKLLYLYYPKELAPLATEISDIRMWLNSLSSDFDIVVGIPRSGLMTASIIAIEFGKPLSTPDQIIQGKYWITRTNTSELKIDVDNAKILLVDDSAGTGTTMEEARELINTNKPYIEIITAATYVSDPSEPYYYYKRFKKQQPILVRALMHNSFIPPVAFDMDGVICEDYAGQEYHGFLMNAKPHKIPIYTIDFIITGRKRKYQQETLDWLQQYNVKWKVLLMCPEDETTISFKSRMIRKYKPGIFVESNPAEAKEINRRTGVLVICIGDEKLYGS